MSAVAILHSCRDAAPPEDVPHASAERPSACPVTVTPRSTSTIHHLPVGERPRERLQKQGAEALSDVELLALFIRTGTREKNAIDIGRDLLTRFGTLGALLSTTRESLAATPGLGPAKIAQLLAITEIVRRAMKQEMTHGCELRTGAALATYLQLLIGGRDREIFVTIFLDVRCRLLHVEEASRGSLTRTAVYPREIIKEALRVQAAAVVVAHNHPSGVLSPSAEDIHLTRRLSAALAMVDIRLLDHFLVSATRTVSFAEEGWDIGMVQA